MHHISNIKYYFINNFDTNNIDQQGKQTVIIYRNYSSKKVNQLEILKFKNYCKKKGLKFYLSNNVKLAIKLRLDGAYIPSFNRSTKHLAYSLKKKFSIIGSAHNLKEIKIKENQKIVQPTSIIKCNNDHRIAMSIAPLSMKVDSIKFDDKEGVNKSYPKCWEDFNRASKNNN